jgi:hypothetical protein
VFACLERRGGHEYDAIRANIESWLQAYPVESLSELLGRFRTDEDWQFHSAFLELYVHELLRRLSHKVTTHPRLPNTPKQPDFLATAADCAAYIECVVVSETSAEERGSQKRLGSLYDAIDKLNSPDFFLALHTEGSPGTPVSGKNWRRKIQDWINSLNYDQIADLGQQGRFEELPSIELCHDGLLVRVEPIAKKGDARGKPSARPIGALAGDAVWVTSRIAIAEALREKATRYGQLHAPYVVFVNCLGEMCDLEEIREAIYGAGGLWPDGKREFTRLSAVVALYHLLPWSVPRANICLFPNPNAAYPYDGPLTQLPQQIAIGPRLEYRSGLDLACLFGLSPDWPRTTESTTT